MSVNTSGTEIRRFLPPWVMNRTRGERITARSKVILSALSLRITGIVYVNTKRQNTFIA